ncbi:MAG: hypothetical protein Q8R10_12315 [Pseudomonas sp.]|uniref:hypothetical protein n=1 Tax=Pseudomonas sp. TaxID=306 RepID=UPI002733920E|nr:hypothetical protein [Pseudomonas sp.]MDP3847195.1 hypothetical protein [Pseudomonas sp.]
MGEIMTVNFEVVINTPVYEVDMKAGLDTLQGVSDATRIIAETLVTGKVPQRKTYKSDVRTTLKRSFKGSYGHIFSLDISDDELKKEYRKIGASAFSELMSYFMKEALYLETDELSEKAQRVILKIENSVELLIKQLRMSAMVDIHEISTKFDHDVVINYRKSLTERVPLAKFDRATGLAIKAKRTDEKLSIVAAIRRFNTNTGNGRLQLEGGDETVAFGFSTLYRDVVFATKKKFSENLDYNNGINIERWRYVEIIASPIRLPDEKIIKYVVKGFHDD